MRSVRRVATAAVALALVSGAPAGAATTTTVKRAPKSTTTTTRKVDAAKIASLTGQLAEASAEEAGLLGKLDSLNAKKRDLDAKLAVLDRQLGVVRSDVDVAEQGLEQASSEVVRAETKLGIAQTGLSDARRRLKERAVDAYVRTPQAEAADLLLRVHTFRQLSAGVSYMGSVVRTQADTVRRFQQLRAEAVSLQAQVEAQRDQARQQRDVVVDRKLTLEEARREQATVRQQLVEQAAQQQAVVAEVRRRKAEFQAQIAALKRDSDSIASFLRGVQRGQAFNGSGKGIFGLPIPGAPLTSTFGTRVHPIYHTTRMHAGVDFGAGSGTPIRAAGDGTVVYAGPRGGYGNVVIIDHGRSLATLYAHQSALLVGTGARVHKGDLIGRVGSTGLSTGPHLHFEVRVNGNPVNPLGYL